MVYDKLITMKPLLVFTLLCLFEIGTQCLAQENSTILSYRQLMLLTDAARTDYINEIRNFIISMEARQTDAEAGLIGNSNSLFSLSFLEFDQALAQDDGGLPACKDLKADDNQLNAGQREIIRENRTRCLK